MFVRRDRHRLRKRSVRLPVAPPTLEEVLANVPDGAFSFPQWVMVLNDYMELQNSYAREVESCRKRLERLERRCIANAICAVLLGVRSVHDPKYCFRREYQQLLHEAYENRLALHAGGDTRRLSEYIDSQARRVVSGPLPSLTEELDHRRSATERQPSKPSQNDQSP